jgi:hypothetical protein
LIEALFKETIFSCLSIDFADGVVHGFQGYWAFPVLIARRIFEFAWLAQFT